MTSEGFFYYRGKGEDGMRIVAINGSPHGMEGNTGRLLDEVLAGVIAAGALAPTAGV